MSHLAGSIKDGEYTKVIYTLIKEGHYKEAIVILNEQLQSSPTSRAALSLLGYCYFHVQDFVNAANCYEQLAAIFPENPEYKLTYAQSLYQACLYQEAMRVSCQIEDPEYQPHVIKLQAAIKYGEDDLSGAKGLVEQFQRDDPDTEVNLGCLAYKEGRYDEACSRFTTALQTEGYNAHLSYAVALCHYQRQQYAPALQHIADIIERGIRDHPELSVGMATEGIDVRSVGNTATLHETALVEAFNLKAAIEYRLQNAEAAREALTDMPPRSEEELDPITLHNQALLNMENSPAEGFEKLQFLLCQPPFPPETFGNLLLLYCRYDYHDLAADLLAENAELSYRHLSPYLYDLLEALIAAQTCPDEAYSKLDAMAAKQTEVLRRLKRKVQEAQQGGKDAAVREYDAALERYLPVLMAQARLFWDAGQYGPVEQVFRKSVEFCNDHDVWRLNVGHVLFMQDNKFKEAAGFYEPLVQKKFERILDVSPVVLANLCVAYIMTSQNEEAEELMRKIEKEEEQLAYEDPDRKIFHLCIVNLVIGTLYCAKGNYDFGISRVIKSLDPFPKKLGTDTWGYAKRCFLSLLENLAKQVILISDAVLQDCLLFLDQCEAHGRDVLAALEPPLHDRALHPGRNTVAYEARQLKALVLKLAVLN
ncbi:intraflagellar transport protein 70A-like [Ornithodoros turicata]|uniref:intraflagellar transport protein 70A-like n=1 Tax=Ornithodoros turicata TaxID=34597 RepID=UPI003139D55F